MIETALSRIRSQIMWDRLIAVVEEQAQTLIRTGFSTSTREAGDLSAGVFDGAGNMLAQAVTGTPGHVNAMASPGRSPTPSITAHRACNLSPADASNRR